MPPLVSHAGSRGKGSTSWIIVPMQLSEGPFSLSVPPITGRATLTGTGLFDGAMALMRDAIATDHPEYDGLQVQAEVLGATSYPGVDSTRPQRCTF